MRKKPFVGQFGAKNVIPPPKDRTHEERVSEFCTPDDEERKMKTRLKFDEFFSRLKLLILYPKWAILCASSSFLPLFFEITMLVLKILLVILPTWWWQIHGKITFFWNFYLMNYWTYTLTDLQNQHGMIAQDCFEDAGTTHTTTFLQKKSIESFLFACCILWFSDQLICCLVFPADLGYIVTELLLYAFICRVYYVYVVVIAPYSLICENSSHFNTTPRGVRWGPAAKFRQPSSPAEIYIICM